MKSFPVQMSSSTPSNLEDQRSTELKCRLDTLRELEDRISILEAELVSARNERDRVQDRILLLRAWHSPVRRLPREILTLIFEYHPDDQEQRNGTLMFVCKLWNEVVMNTPWLWSNIILTLDDIETVHPVWKYAHTCIERSRGNLLSIFLDAQEFDPAVKPSFENILSGSGISTNSWNYYPYNEDRRFDELFNAEVNTNDPAIYEYGLLIALGILRGDEDQHMSRWRSLRIYVHHELSYHAAFYIWETSDGGTPNLEELDFRGGGVDYSSFDPDDLPGIATVSRLVVDLNVTFVGGRNTSLQHLQHLGLHHPESALGLTLHGFSELQSLRSLELVDYSISADKSRYKTFVLPNLQYLALQCSTILRQFDVPRLTHLSISWMSKPSEYPPEMVSTITDFRYGYYGSYDSDLPSELESIVPMMSRLQRLHLPESQVNYYAMVDRTLEEMREGGHTIAYCVNNPNSWPVRLQVL
jgi:F-box-like